MSFDLKETMLSWTTPLWALVVMLFITLVKTWPIIQRNVLDAKERRESRYSERISKLEAALKECQDECEDTKEALRNDLRMLQEQRLSDRAQHLQEQISLVSIIIKSVDNPMLEHILMSLQNAKQRLPHVLTGVTGDAQNQSDK